MAKNRPEPAKSVDSEEEESEQEEEEASSDENGGSDSEPETPLTQVSTKKPSASAPKKPQPSSQPKRVSSSEESGSESDDDSDSNPNVKPIASKPMDAPSAAATPTKKPRSKPAAPRPTSPTKSAAGTKRPAAADGEAKESKKSKKKPNPEVESSVKKSVTEDSKKKPSVEVESSAKKSLSEDSKKQLFQRLWSEEDEIAVLKGMIAYTEEKNADPVADLNAFHDFIRESLHIDVTRTQLQDKIRRLKKKYENNARTSQKKGKERTFSKIHEQNGYDLSKKIWGGHKAQNGSVVKAAESSKASNASARKDRIKNAVIPVKDSTVAAAAEVVDHVLDEEKEANTNMDVDINVEASKSLNLSGGSLFGKSVNELAEWIEKNKAGLSEEKLIEMEGKWKALKVAELELFLKKTALIQEQGRLVLDALK
ncbi:GLABROUS1 enhancer-binding protein-like [Ipomoea triloba]|uniref:GLABROUS1 enhancer-binding protein-like n=1 Tax=Ipomoea triloba TaxID=35885 RepID=UPI00125E4C0C|nr:GLABROUS1 enhancer-binding protein-like [Ipomoea triloba]